MVKKKILIVTDTLPWGHRSIARAIYGYLKKTEKENNFEVSFAEVKIPFTLMNDLYTFVYRFFPLSNRITLKLMENEMLRKTFLEMADYNLPDLQKLLNRTKPDLVISTYFLHSQSLAKWKKESGAKFKLWTVVADPWSVNPISFIDGADLHLVYDEIVAEAAKEYGVEAERVLKTGWWVREEMYDNKFQNQNFKCQMRKKLGFSDDRPIVFVGGGSLGTNSLMKLLPVLMVIKTKVGFIFNTGTDKLLYNMVEEYVKILKKLRRNETIQIKNLGWIENMGEVLAASDIVFGKAGPNFLFDVMAVKKPFVAITHIGGQEDGNIDLIRQKKLGWVKEEGNLAADFLLEYLQDPKKYQLKLVKSIKEESENNRKTGKKIVERVKKELKIPPRALLQ